MKKNIGLDSSVDEKNKKKKMRKRKNKENTDEISQGLLIKPKKNEKNCSKKVANFSYRNRTKKRSEKQK